MPKKYKRTKKVQKTTEIIDSPPQTVTEKPILNESREYRLLSQAIFSHIDDINELINRVEKMGKYIVDFKVCKARNGEVIVNAVINKKDQST